MPRVILSLGSNLGDREAQLDFAVSSLSANPRIKILKQSKRYDTAPVDVPDEYHELIFLNAALLIETDLVPLELLDVTQAIEQDAHRVRIVRNGPRTLDIDIIAYQGVVCKTERLVLPHPRAVERDFVKIPVADLGVNLLDAQWGL